MAKKSTSPVYISTRLTGKMSGINAISTSCMKNEQCAKNRRVPGSICEKCYAARTLEARSNVEAAYARNTDVLRELLPVEALPLINAAVFRFEAFGDLYCVNQVANYFNICRKNPDTMFALWTKNPHIIARAISAGHSKPDNIVIILSSLFINKTADPSRYDFVDKVFTVYDKDHIPESGINCGSRNCLECRRCYRKDTESDIRELLK